MTQFDELSCLLSVLLFFFDHQHTRRTYFYNNVYHFRLIQEESDRFDIGKRIKRHHGDANRQRSIVFIAIRLQFELDDPRSIAFPAGRRWAPPARWTTSSSKVSKPDILSLLFSFLLRSTFFPITKKRIEHFHSQFYSGPLSFFLICIFFGMSGISLSRCVWYVMNDSRFVLHAVFRHRKSVGDCLRRLFSWRIYLTFELFEWTADIIIIRPGERARFLSSSQRENVNTNTNTHKTKTEIQTTTQTVELFKRDRRKGTHAAATTFR